MLYAEVSGLDTNKYAEHDGTVISFRARIHTLRRMSAKMVFMVFRQQTMTIQGVLASFKPKGEAIGTYSCRGQSTHS
jgi:aspartyl/asparaginyl-tRNA synthetase